jgi:acyl dehydratase
VSTILETGADMMALVGTVLGTSDWVLLDQRKVDAFAELTGDDHWIHVDVARAAQEMPQGKTIVHGFLVLALIPFMQRSVFTIRQRGKGLNYGCNRVRFVRPVPVGAHVRLRQAVKDCVKLDNAVRITFDCVIEVEGEALPAIVAETLLQIFDVSP